MNKKEILEKLAQSILKMDIDLSKEAAKEAADAKLDSMECIEMGLSKGIREVGDRFDRGELYLPHLVMAADAFKAAVDVLEEGLPKGKTKWKSLGKVVIGTIKGDIHDIGKNIVATMLRVNGFEVVDIGTDQPISNFISTARAEGADIIGASTLLTSGLMEIEELVKELKNSGFKKKCKVMVGGGPTTREWAESIKADGWAPDATKAVEVAKRLVSK